MWGVGSVMRETTVSQTRLTKGSVLKFPATTTPLPLHPPLPSPERKTIRKNTHTRLFLSPPFHPHPTPHTLPSSECPSNPFDTVTHSAHTALETGTGETDTKSYQRELEIPSSRQHCSLSRKLKQTNQNRELEDHQILKPITHTTKKS